LIDKSFRLPEICFCNLRARKKRDEMFMDSITVGFISIFKVKTTSFSWLALAFKISL
jgi:hypothetical protein